MTMTSIANSTGETTLVSKIMSRKPYSGLVVMMACSFARSLLHMLHSRPVNGERHAPVGPS